MRYLSTIRIFLDNLTLNLVQTSVESESQKLEHVLEESNVRTKTKIKERLKDENKYFSIYRTEAFCVSNKEHIWQRMCATYMCNGYETKPTALIWQLFAFFHICLLQKKSLPSLCRS